MFLMVTLRYAMNPAKTIWVVFAAMVVAPLAFIIVPGLPAGLATTAFHRRLPLGLTHIRTRWL